MIIIAHRGNLHGPSADTENSLPKINAALDAGYDVECDVWWFPETGFWLGHDRPEQQVAVELLRHPRMWCHAKRPSALMKMLDDGRIHCFHHLQEEVALTSQGFLWTLPQHVIWFGQRSVCMLPGKPLMFLHPASCYAVCTDFAELYRAHFAEHYRTHYA